MTGLYELYGGWKDISNYTQGILQKLLEARDMASLFMELSEDEMLVKKALIEVERKYLKVVREDNMDNIISIAMKKRRER